MTADNPTAVSFRTGFRESSKGTTVPTSKCPWRIWSIAINAAAARAGFTAQPLGRGAGIINFHQSKYD